MIALLLALLAQQGPTVGDTLWIGRVLAVPRGAAVRPAPWSPTGDVEVLGPARVERHGDSVLVAYPAVAWRPGTHEVNVPGALLLLEGGGVDSLPGFRATVTVASVLPAQRDSTVAVQPPAETVRRGERSPRPLVLLLAGALLALAPLHWWWRRRGEPLPDEARRAVATPPLARWAEAGEARAALAVAASALRDAVARGCPNATAALETERCIEELRAGRPGWPLDEIATVLRALDEARFRPEAYPDAAGLVERAGRVTDVLTGRAA
ncbi:MAG TPA: hypothetical protein VFX50_07925 [Gemmatimonadales bacterium]|nr:hypothetical protein [Gemmatimonadales bacterium]